MKRAEALVKLKALVGTDLRTHAAKLKIAIHFPKAIGGKSIIRTNKGWAGHTVERFLGLSPNSSRLPDFGEWELKVISVHLRPDLGLRVKETMAITMIEPNDVKAKAFEESHLYRKMSSMIVVARIFVDVAESTAPVHSVSSFDLEDPKIYQQVKADYELVRDTLHTKGFGALTGKMGVLVQPRTKGPGHGSTTRAFYARPRFVAHIIGLEVCEL